MGSRASIESHRMEGKEVPEMIRLSKNEKILIKRLHENGYTYESIAKDFEISETEVKKIIQENKKENV